MCDVMTALTVGMSAFQYMAGQSQAESQYAAQAAATKQSYEQIADKQQQINQQAALNESERTKQGMLERAKIATIAGESGALGLSSDRLINDSFMQQGVDVSSIEQNRQNSIQEAEWKMEQAQAKGSAANLETASKAPSLVGTGLQIGADIYGGTQKAKTKVTGVQRPGNTDKTTATDSALTINKENGLIFPWKGSGTIRPKDKARGLQKTAELGTYS